MAPVLSWRHFSHVAFHIASPGPAPEPPALSRPQGVPRASLAAGASILGPLNLGGGGGANDTLNLNDQHDPNSEVFNFAIDQFNFGDLTLANNSTFDMSFNGFNTVNLAANGHSTVNDPNDPNGILDVS
jgi:hypothetical protein